MNLVFALGELGKARRFVTEGRRCMIRQRKIVDELDSRGHDTLEALQLLEYSEAMQEGYVALRDRLEERVMDLVRLD